MDFPEYTDARYADRRVPSQQIRYAHTQVHIHTSYLNFALQSYHLQGETSKRKTNTSIHVHPHTWIKHVPFIVVTYHVIQPHFHPYSILVALLRPVPAFGKRRYGLFPHTSDL